jgi:subtilisin family serine protease
MTQQITATIAVLMSATLLTTPALAQKKSNAKTTPALSVVPLAWMHSDVGEAWRSGYRGQGVTVTVVDDFRSRSRFDANLSGKKESLRHGEWTLKEASLIAPSAKMVAHDFNSKKKVKLNFGLNVLNVSYGTVSTSNLSAFRWSAQDQSIIQYAHQGSAVVAKSAGNEYGLAVGQASSSRQLDFLNRELIGARSAIFVGALNAHGTVQNPATMADYSNIAGHNSAVQNQFLVVGVDRAKTQLQGTSFAAPVVSAYAAILGSKFTQATPTQVTNQLLNTARTDTILGYSPSIHGKGEASISRAMAPISIR